MRGSHAVVVAEVGESFTGWRSVGDVRPRVQGVEILRSGSSGAESGLVKKGSSDQVCTAEGR